MRHGVLGYEAMGLKRLLSLSSLGVFNYEATRKIREIPEKDRQMKLLCSIIILSPEIVSPEIARKSGKNGSNESENYLERTSP